MCKDLKIMIAMTEATLNLRSTALLISEARLNLAWLKACYFVMDQMVF